MFISVYQSFGQFKVFKNVYTSLQLLVTKAYNVHTHCPNTKLTHPNRFSVLDTDQGNKNPLSTTDKTLSSY